MKALSNLPKEKIQQLVLTGILTLLAVASLFHFYLGKQWTALTSSREQITKLQRRLQEAEKEAAEEAKNKHLRGQVQALVDEQRQAMVTGDPLMWVVREVTLLAERHPVRMQTPRAGLVAPHGRRPRLQTYTTRLELSGEYDQLGQFIRDLENRFASAEVQMLEVGSGADGGALRAQLELALLLDASPPPVVAPVEERPLKKE